METPLWDFVENYIAAHMVRGHMPGHKGRALLGPEAMDITEIPGAEDKVYQSEENAGKIFGCHTFYSTGGSSHCIRAMVTLALQWGTRQGRKPLIAAGRNAHRAFLSAVALLDLQVLWLEPTEGESYLSCHLTPDRVDAFLQRAEEKPFALYLTSPDYLGSLADIRGIAEACRKHGCLLLVDNAHGAYLRFLEKSLHPIDLGADLCCDSAHKTMPVLTGGAYLHVSLNAPEFLAAQARNALALYATTSPSFLILQSLDLANAWAAEGKISAFAVQVADLRSRLEAKGLHFYGEEPLKLTVEAAPLGYTGTALAEKLRARGVECEFADPDYLVLMLSPKMEAQELVQIEDALSAIEPKTLLPRQLPAFHRCRQVMSVRQAMLAPAETVAVEQSLGRVLAAPSVGCPPAVPIVICGEQIDEAAIDMFYRYGIRRCTVVEES